MLDPNEALGHSERLVGWLRLPAIAVIVAGELVSRSGADEQPGFLLAGGLFAGWAVAVLLLAYLRPVTPLLSVTASVVDVGAITALVFLSGGGFSQARLAYVFVPVTVAFRFRPVLTAVAGAAVVVAYLSQALGHVSRNESDALRFIVVQASYLTWLSAAAALLAFVLRRQLHQIHGLAARARHLLIDALGTEERERQAIAEELHDSALQDLLSVRHDLQEAAEAAAHPALDRAEATVAKTVRELRLVVTELHPLVLEEAGLAAALSAAAAVAGERGGFHAHVDYAASPRPGHEQLLLAAARELLLNAAKHARARRVDVRCLERDGWIVLSVTDDGTGFDVKRAAERVSEGHIGLASQRARVEAAGGDLRIDSSIGGGTVATVRVPRSEG